MLIHDKAPTPVIIYFHSDTSIAVLSVACFFYVRFDAVFSFTFNIMIGSLYVNVSVLIKFSQKTSVLP